MICRSVIAVAVLATLASFARSQTPPPAKPACASTLFRQFDFWVGEWDVKDQAGKYAGRNSVTSQHNGCVIVEQWTSARGGTGLSMNYYNPETGQWRQNWVGLDVLLEMTGGMKDGAMVMEGPLQQLGAKRVTLLRGIWTPLPDGRVRQHFVESSDQGKTWNEWFDGYYSRAAKAGP